MRFVLIWHPTKRKQICSHKIFLSSLAIVIFASFAANIHFFFTSKIKNSVCYSFAPLTYSKSLMINSTVLFNCFIPNAISILLNILMIRKLNTLGLKLRKIKKQKECIILKKKLLIHTFVFILFLTPLRLLTIYTVVNREADNFKAIAYMRKIFALLVSFYYSICSLVHILILKRISAILDQIFKN